MEDQQGTASSYFAVPLPKRRKKNIAQAVKIIVKLPKNYLVVKKSQTWFATFRYRRRYQIVLGTFFLPKLTERWQQVIERNGQYI